MITYSKYTSNGAALTKQYLMSDDGEIRKTTSAKLYSGTVETVKSLIPALDTALS